jgi:hypothetical protein
MIMTVDIWRRRFYDMEKFIMVWRLGVNLVGALWSGIEDTAHVKFGGDLHFQLGSVFIIKNHNPYFT